MKIMLVDDEVGIHAIVERIAHDSGYEYYEASGGEEAIGVFFETNPDLLILDVMMPDVDGFQVCRELRAKGCLVPIIFLTAKGDIVDKGVGFDVGGDDYIVKPFSPKELSMRIKAHLRRQQRSLQSAQDNIHAGDLTIEIKRRKVLIHGKPIELTPKEFLILMLMASHPGEVFTHEQLIEEVWGKEYVGETTSIAVFIRKIREKIEVDPSKPRYLQTVWRSGYRFGD